MSIALAASALVVQAQVFSAPKNLSNNGTAEFGQIAVDPSGNINVVWDESGNFDIFFSRSTDGGVTFSTPKNLSNNAGSSVFPQIAVDSSGNINVVWEDSTPGNFNIFFCHSNNGGVTFSAPKNLSNMAGVSAGAQIAVDSGGNINMVWDNFNGTNSDIFFSHSTDGGVSFSAPKDVSNNAGASVFPGVDAATNRGNIAVDSSGNINVVWDDFTPGNSQIFFSRSTDGGATFSTPKSLSNNAASSGSSQIAVDSAGNINVAWGNFNGTNSDIFFSRSTDGGVSFSVPKNLSNNGFSASSRIAVDSGGNINVVWENTGTNSDIFFSRSINGVTFATPKNLSSDASFSGDAQIAVDPSGNINVVWGNLTSGGIAGSAVLFAGSTDGGVSFSTPKILSNNAFQPQIAVGPSGNINVIWDNITSPPISSEIFYSGSVSPTIASVSPSSGLQGQNITDFTVNGTDFDPSAVLSFSGTGIVVNSYVSRTATQIVASISVAGNAPVGAQAVFVTNPGGQHSTLQGGFTVLQGAVILPDFSITSVRSVQVVFDSDANGDGITDLVLGKATAFEVTVHVNNPGGLQSEVPIQITFDGASYQRTFSITQSGIFDTKVIFSPSPPIRPTTAGIKRIFTVIDPDNTIAESDKTNNEMSTTIEVKITTILRVVYVPVPQCSSPLQQCYGLPGTPREDPTVTEFNGNRFMRATYPLADDALTSILSVPIFGTPFGSMCMSVFSPLPILSDMVHIAGAAFISDPHYDRSIGVAPLDYFDFHGYCGYSGVTNAAMNVSLVAEGHWTAVAHEIGHTFGLPVRPLSAHEEYIFGDPTHQGNPAAEGFWVLENISITGGSRLCFMGTAGFEQQALNMRWIDKDDYEHLFQQLRTNPNDPEVVLVSGTVDRADKVQLFDWRASVAGRVDTSSQTEYQVEFVAPDGNLISTQNLAVSFRWFAEPHGAVYADSTYFAQRMEFPAYSFALRITHLGHSIATANPFERLLLDTVASIPDRGFVQNVTQRKTALHNKAEAIAGMIAQHDFQGAIMALTYDFRPALDRWLVDGYGIANGSQLSKLQVFDVVDQVVRHLNTLRSAGFH